MAMDVGRWRVEPGTKVRLEEADPGEDGGYPGGKEAALEEIARLNGRLEALQELLWAEGKHRLLVVLQAMDTGGKDGVIRRVFQGVNPQGVRVAAFKVPTPPELARDYLWRVHSQVPGKGEVVIFNRSHYEDVLVVRVHGLVPEEAWRRRYRQINDFERLLAEEGTTILKFFLHISPGEQKKRLEARLADPTKVWKFSVGDLAERERWPRYMDAYQEALERTSTRHAPWYLVPADRKWFRDLVVARVIVDALEGLGMEWPPPPPGLEGLVIR
jgi:PPK2 family polyphosphate:nucleotide phosphotransferase